MFDLKRFLFDANINQREMATALGVTPQAITNIKQGKMNVPPEWHSLILEKFNLNAVDYINQVKPTIVKKYTEGVEVMQKEFIKAKVVNAYAYASYSENWDDPEYYKEMEELETTQREDGNYLWFEIKGDSMARELHPSYDQGTYILGRELYRKHWSGLQLKRAKVWIINHRENGLMIKEIIKQDKNLITCHSWNPLVEDFVLDLNDVVQLFYYKEARYK
jgi:transcriptional regulator with XRE-family HTH domain